MMNFNIQLFADAQTNTTGTMSVEMKTFYEKRLIDQAEPRLVHDQFADYYPVPQNGGTFLVHIQRNRNVCLSVLCSHLRFSHSCSLIPVYASTDDLRQHKCLSICIYISN